MFPGFIKIFITDEHTCIAGNFHRAIIQSGTAISPWAVGVPNSGILLASALGISTDDPEEMINQLLAVPGNDIFSAYTTLDVSINFLGKRSQNNFLSKLYSSEETWNSVNV